MRGADTATRWLVRGGLALALVAAGCGSSDESADEEEAAEAAAVGDESEGGDGAEEEQPETAGLIPEGDWTDEQVEFMLDRIEQTEAVLPETFPTEATEAELEETLGEMGFYNFGATAPGGYAHWINPTWMMDEHLVEPEFSESLVYQSSGGDQWRLVAAMYMTEPTDTLDDIPEEVAWLPGWHVHPELCVQPDGGFGGVTDPDNPNCPEGTSQSDRAPMFHIWLEDPGCDHRFGGIGVDGLHCEHGSHGGHDDSMEMDGSEGDGEHADDGHEHEGGEDHEDGHDHEHEEGEGDHEH